MYRNGKAMLELDGHGCEGSIIARRVVSCRGWLIDQWSPIADPIESSDAGHPDLQLQELEMARARAMMIELLCV